MGSMVSYSNIRFFFASSKAFGFVVPLFLFSPGWPQLFGWLSPRLLSHGYSWLRISKPSNPTNFHHHEKGTMRSPLVFDASTDFFHISLHPNETNQPTYLPTNLKHTITQFLTRMVRHSAQYLERHDRRALSRLKRSIANPMCDWVLLWYGHLHPEQTVELD